MIKYSVFAPVYNEEANIIPLYKEIKDVMEGLKEEWELIYVNDGSKDKSLDKILSIKDKHVRCINNRRNYGQAVSMEVGARHCRGEILISIDSDMQNDPRDIPRLLKKLEEENLDVVAGWRFKRKDPAWMHVVTMSARMLRAVFAKDGVHDSGCTLRVYRREFFEDLELWGEMHRYIVALLKWKGAKVGELKVNHRHRVHGKSNYNWKKSFKGFVDLMYIAFWKNFFDKPLHLFGIMGVFLMFLGMLSGIVTIYLKVVENESLSDSLWFVMSFFLFLVGFQFFISGIMLDIIIRSYYSTSREKRYVTKEITIEEKRSK